MWSPKKRTVENQEEKKAPPKRRGKKRQAAGAIGRRSRVKVAERLDRRRRQTRRHDRRRALRLSMDRRYWRRGVRVCVEKGGRGGAGTRDKGFDQFSQSGTGGAPLSGFQGILYAVAWSFGAFHIPARRGESAIRAVLLRILKVSVAPPPFVFVWEREEKDSSLEQHFLKSPKPSWPAKSYL